jgi:8-oxo-dGTP diphosphatase
VSGRIVVVAAVIERDGRVLVTRRPAGTPLEGLWEFPGGKCLPGETHADALGRELAEELDCAAEIGDHVHSVTHDDPDQTVELHFYRCRIAGDPRPMIGQDVRWIERGRLHELPFPDADRALIGRLARGARDAGESGI